MRSLQPATPLRNYVDRVNVSFANLRMSADLGFSDRAYGLGPTSSEKSPKLFTSCPGAFLQQEPLSAVSGSINISLLRLTVLYPQVSSCPIPTNC